MILPRLNRSVCVGVVLAITLVSQAYAQLMMYSKEQRIEFTSAWEGERFSDGRPKVSDSILKRMKTVSAEEAWSVLVRGADFRDHFEDGWKEFNPSSERMVGRVVTALFLPTRPDVRSVVDAQGIAEERSGTGHNSWVIDTLQPGDVLVVTPTSPCEDGYFGELLATSLVSRGVKGLIIEAGCRDIAELTEMKFPVWSKAVCAQGTVKETTADVNMPVVCGAQLINPGDLIVADDDGVVVVRRKDAKDVLDKSIAREEKEAKSRTRYIDGEMGLDMYGWRERLAAKGLTYIDEMPEE